jgi:hypothetical protein
VFTDAHYSVVIAPKNRRRSGGGEPSVEEVMEVYNTVAAHSGTYTVSGSRATLKRLANTRAEVIDEDMVFDFTLEGDKLTTRVVRGASRIGVVERMWRKVS